MELKSPQTMVGILVPSSYRGALRATGGGESAGGSGVDGDEPGAPLAFPLTPFPLVRPFVVGPVGPCEPSNSRGGRDAKRLEMRSSSSIIIATWTSLTSLNSGSQWTWTLAM